MIIDFGKVSEETKGAPFKQNQEVYQGTIRLYV